MYEQTTRGIKVAVEPHYLSEQSDPDLSQYFWAYRVAITNEGNDVVQLTDRYWHISDATGHVEEVRGPGVVGEQPILRPGDTFEYTSGCPLATPSGFMVGRYTMKDSLGSTFEVDIPAFSLDLPDARPSIN